MKVYEWTVLCDDIVLDKGEKHAPNEVQLEKYIGAVLVPKYPAATSWVYSQLLCDDCLDGNNDVTAYYVNEKRVVKCRDCRSEYFRTTRNYGTVKKSDTGL